MRDGRKDGREDRRKDGRSNKGILEERDEKVWEFEMVGRDREY